VLSQNPARRLPSFLRRIAMVSGSRGILSWDLTANDTLELLRRIYSCPRDEYYRHVEDLAEKLSVRDMLTTPVRQLSLGQRRKCELLAVFARRPELVFLDEPTLGLDVGSRHTLWDFIEYLSERGTFTTILTSHYMEDVERLCDRVILLHEGQVIFDNPTAQAGPKLGSGIRVVVDSPTPDAIEAAHPGLCRRENGRLVCDVECMADAAKILQQIMSGDRSRIHAVSVRHESLDEVMRRLGEE
jgi:ABC-2 type transport system ATP-binding protein